MGCVPIVCYPPPHYPNSVKFVSKFTSANVHSWVDRGIVRVTCLAHDQTKAHTQTSWYRVSRANHDTAVTPLLNNANGEFEVNGIRGDARAHAVPVGKRVCSKLDSKPYYRNIQVFWIEKKILPVPHKSVTYLTRSESSQQMTSKHQPGWETPYSLSLFLSLLLRDRYC